MSSVFQHITGAAIFLETLADDITPVDVQAATPADIEYARLKIEAGRAALDKIEDALEGEHG